MPAGCNPPCGPGCTCDPATLVCTCPIACTSPAGMPADFCTYSAVEQRCALIYRNLLGFWPNAAQAANAVAIWNCAGVYGEVGGHMCTSQPGENWTGTSWLAFRLISDQAQAFVKRVSARAGVAPVDPLPWAWIDACIEIVLGRPGNGQAGDPFEPGWLPQGGAQLGGERARGGAVRLAAGGRVRGDADSLAGRVGGRLLRVDRRLSRVQRTGGESTGDRRPDRLRRLRERLPRPLTEYPSRRGGYAGVAPPAV